MTNKQRAFALEYVRDFNATQAAIRAGYSEKTAKQQGSRLLSKVDVQKVIRSHFAKAGMTADEVSARITAQARGEAPTEWVDEQGRKFQPHKALQDMAKITGLYEGEEDDREVRVMVVRSAKEVWEEYQREHAQNGGD